MSSVPRFRDFICDRLSAVAEEIFQVFEKTVFEYEEQLRHQRRELDTASKPETHKFPQQDVCKREQEETLTQHQCSNRSSLKQENYVPARIKEEHQDLCTNWNEKPLVLKEENDISLQTATCEKDILDEDQTPSLDQGNSHYSTIVETSIGKIIVDSPDVIDLDPNNEDQLLFNEVSSVGHDNREYQIEELEIPSSIDPPKKSTKCEICGKAFNHRSDFIRHQRIHTGVKPFTCNMCGKGFNQSSMLIDHKRVHTGDKPYPCDFCGKKFNRKSAVTVHHRVHTGEKPFSCEVCGEGFISSTMLKRHTVKHTGAKSYLCLICRRRFHKQSDLKNHSRVHMQ